MAESETTEGSSSSSLCPPVLRLFRTSAFKKLYDKLDADTQRLVDLKLDLFSRQPTSPRLKRTQLKGKGKGYEEIYASIGIRVIFRPGHFEGDDGSVFIVFWVGEKEAVGKLISTLPKLPAKPVARPKNKRRHDGPSPPFYLQQ